MKCLGECIRPIHCHIHVVSYIYHYITSQTLQNIEPIGRHIASPTLWFVFKLSTCFLKTTIQNSLQINFTTSRISENRDRSRVILYRVAVASQSRHRARQDIQETTAAKPFNNTLSQSVAELFKLCKDH